MAEKYGYRDLLIEALGGNCKKCQSVLDLEIDHIKPRSKGGAHTIPNIQILCHVCHKKKTKEDLKGTQKLTLESNRKKSPTLLHISNNLRALRIGLNHRQEDVGNTIGMPRGTYAGFEVGLFLPKPNILDSFTDFFKCEPTDLYSDEILHIINLESNNYD